MSKRSLNRTGVCPTSGAVTRPFWTPSWLLLSTVLLVLTAPAGLRALEDNEIPASAPQDAVMASPGEIQEVLDWASLAFTGRRPAGRAPAVGVELRRQDHSSLRFGQSCMETPLKIGNRSFEHGLGTHANSEIALHLPPGAKTFHAFVGIDNNFDTQGQRGSVEFSVEAGGQSRFHSAVLRGGQAPVPVQVDLPAGTTELILKVDTTPDGPSCDQADWAEARITLADGSSVWADEDRQGFVAPALPFSFRYGGAASTDLLPTWARSVETKAEPTRFVHEVSWTEVKTGLRVRATVTAFRQYPAVEWVLHFENTGATNTPILEEIQALDAPLRTGFYAKPAVLHQIAGDSCNEQSFLPFDTQLEAGKPLRLAPAGGRSSNGAFPFFNLQYGEEGLITALGWSGQWAARFERSSAGPTRLVAGQEKTHLTLHPGESLRTPRILLMPWKGDRMTAQNRWRRLLLFEYAPKQNQRPLRLPVALQCFDRYSWNQPDWSTEAGQVRAAQATFNLGCDTHWLDAAWFEGGFPNGVGNWFCRPMGFPNGLKPVSEVCHRQGGKFLVWFEPERVAPGTQVAREHPEFVFGGPKGGLFKLNDPAARRWLTDLLVQRIEESGIDVYRNDFNLDPLGYWRANDAPDRAGVTEIEYVEGHYALWDELRARRPGLWIDNCASGGRRIDLETLSRSVPLWRSDTGCAPGHADWDQVQAYGLSQYLPLFTACAWEPKAYVLRSAAAGGIICQFDFMNEKFSASDAHAALAEEKENQKYWYGDYYPLTPCSTSPTALIAYQFHRSDLAAGIVLAFRRGECPYPAVQVNLRGLEPDKNYTVEVFDEARSRQQKTIRGRDLQTDWELRLPGKSQSVLVRYKLQ